MATVKWIWVLKQMNGGKDSVKSRQENSVLQLNEALPGVSLPYDVPLIKEEVWQNIFVIYLYCLYIIGSVFNIPFYKTESTHFLMVKQYQNNALAFK